MANGIVIAQTTVDGEDRARELARGAVEGRLAACAHVEGPVTAVYRWQGTVETATEWRVSYKTTRDRLPALGAWIERVHGYEVPEWIVVAVDGGSDAYLAWVAAESAPA
ncbi:MULTISPECIES: divalent-cation tolerance protein CutA [unclassified Streptomyces]|uniref:divalent-cation tolerance protein CutA n=1 Tax=unclassified Streptomyces TaxID=2593676 RepID=UPI0004AB47B3|nr:MULTISPECIES: divalent-cation tolerance protein CutA [unclassified Streptomyces]APU42159.1 divalent-cation tolerance protein CutA [Streptomyces sp. TN58]KJK45481.1 cation tolerance protein CutA [Streptomyces sp. NRRL F-4428]